MKSIGLNDNVQSWMLLVFLASIWGASFIFIKIALESIAPLAIATGRIVIAACLLLVVVKLSRESLPRWGKCWIYIACVAVFGNVLPFALISYGERVIDSSLASILMSTVPLFNLVIIYLATSDERITLEKMLGLSVGFYGIIMLIGFDALSSLGNETLHQLMVAGGALCYAISGFLGRNLKSLPKLPASAAILTTASVLILPVTFFGSTQWVTEDVAISAIASVVALGILSTALAQLLILRILQLRDPSFLAINNYMVPMFGVIWGMLILSEKPDVETLLAFVVILVGIFISQMKFADNPIKGLLSAFK